MTEYKLLRCRQDDVVRPQPADRKRKTLHLRLPVEKPAVQPAVLKRLQLLDRGQRPNVECYIGMPPRKPVQGFRRSTRPGGVFQKADAQPTAAALRHPTCRQRRFVHGGQYGAGVDEIGSAGVGQFAAPPSPNKQVETELRLEILDLAGDPGWATRNRSAAWRSPPWSATATK